MLNRSECHDNDIDRLINGSARCSHGAAAGELVGVRENEDPVRRVVHLLLGLYLLPALVVVLALGGVLVAVEVSVRSLAGTWRRLRRPWRRYEDRAASLPLSLPSRPMAVERLEARTKKGSGTLF